ncbi:flagellar basal body L-ring protein FlgH [Alphaproteobacteria bacterium]|jgi:flagellar L-ring protein precursor FlgH|nr:flagellar basal body L-ring protein FlgH [Alphaproteobacteria bacterium]MDC1133947.1 flagellar basal body L-ring protein FlgH [Alphaproteobacteria bacterium]|tara:strand:- start:153 stop:815 length:663 start_codon:yes stop_codon:yes gene_type:complete
MKKILIICILFLINGCSTYVEEAINAEFKPLTPSFEEFKKIPPSNGSIYSGSSAGLFSSDRRAHKVGDILTVTLNETFSSSKSVSTASSKADAIGAEVGPTGLLRNFAGLGGSASKSNSFSGSGSAAQSNSLTGYLSVTVVRVFPNGNLQIKGQKKLRLTEGSEYIRINGIVRPQDITATNYVSSSQIAEANIEYVGAGSLANEARPGWGSQLFRALSPF